MSSTKRQKVRTLKDELGRPLPGGRRAENGYGGLPPGHPGKTGGLK